MSDGIPEELERVNNFILSCFENVDCYLFPYPGDKVASSAKFVGQLSGKKVMIDSKLIDLQLKSLLLLLSNKKSFIIII